MHGLLSRRDFLHRAAQFAAVGMTGEALLTALSPRFAEARQVPVDDPRIKTRYVEVPSPNGYGKLRGYMAQPVKAKGKLPTVLIVHENRGLNPHIEDIARRVALDNFIAFARMRCFLWVAIRAKTRRANCSETGSGQTREDFLAAELSETSAQGMAKLAWSVSATVAALPTPGDACGSGGSCSLLWRPACRRTPRIRRCCCNTRGKDNASARRRRTAGVERRVKYQVYSYPDVEHGFNNDTTPRYDEAAATLAWKRTIEFLNKYLRA